MSKYTQPFVFQHFKVFQDKAAMKVGTDGVVLGAWVNAPETGTVLDVGTGTGLLALMIAQRCQAQIHAIDIDSDAAQQAAENFALSPWKERLTAEQCALRNYQPKHTIDLIIANPPFFTDSLKSGNEQRDTARHTDSLLPKELFAFAAKHLSPSGRICLIFPAHHREEVLQDAWRSGLVCTQEIAVIPKPEKKTERILFEFARDRQGPCLREDLILFEPDGITPTTQWRDLAQGYYLRF